jgi:hypothetical protein
MFWCLFGFAGCFVGLYGRLVGEYQRNGYLFFLGPTIFPAVSLLLRLATPWNPFRVTGSRMFGSGAGEDDPDSKRLVQLLNSRTAQGFLVQTTVKLSLTLLLFMAVIAALQREPLFWSFASSWLIMAIPVSIIGASIVLHTELAKWAVSEWVKQEGRAGGTPLMR